MEIIRTYTRGASQHAHGTYSFWSHLQCCPGPLPSCLKHRILHLCHSYWLSNLVLWQKLSHNSFKIFFPNLITMRVLCRKWTIYKSDIPFEFQKKVFSIPMFNFFKKRSRTFYKRSLKETLRILDMCHLSKINKLKTGLWFMVSFIIMKMTVKNTIYHWLVLTLVASYDS